MNKTILATLVFFFVLFALPAYAAMFTRDLYQGLQSDSDVRMLQQFLVEQGVYSGPVTGNFYSLTTQGVVSFQRREGIIPLSGYFGPKTRARANELITRVGGAIELPAQNTAIQIRATEPSSPPNVPSVRVDSAELQVQLNDLLRRVALLQDQLRTQEQSQVPSSPTQPTPVSADTSVTVPANQTVIYNISAPQNPQPAIPPAATSSTSTIPMGPIGPSIIMGTGTPIYCCSGQ